MTFARTALAALLYPYCFVDPRLSSSRSRYLQTTLRAESCSGKSSMCLSNGIVQMR